MKAIVIMEHGGIDKLCFEEMPVPKIAADEVLVEVKAVALNHPRPVGSWWIARI